MFTLCTQGGKSAEAAMVADLNVKLEKAQAQIAALEKAKEKAEQTQVSSACHSAPPTHL